MTTEDPKECSPPYLGDDFAWSNIDGSMTLYHKPSGQSASFASTKITPEAPFPPYSVAARQAARMAKNWERDDEVLVREAVIVTHGRWD
jgi:hypothetical protein